MTKNTSIVLLSIFTALILFVGVFSFLPGGLQYGQYNEYNSPSSLIQLGADLGQSVKGVYNVELVEDDETSTLENVQKVLNNRLGSVYSYYNTPISAEGSVLEISIPKTSNKENSSAVLHSKIEGADRLFSAHLKMKRDRGKAGQSPERGFAHLPDRGL